MIARFVALTIVAGLLSFTAHAQTTLQDLVSESYSEWMFGEWQAQGTDDPVTLSITWDLDKKVVVLHIKASEMESKGYTALGPNDEYPSYVTFDNRGGTGKGSWNQENDELVLRMEGANPGGQTWKRAFVFVGSASSGLKVRMHNIDSSGELVSPARQTFTFKKK